MASSEVAVTENVKHLSPESSHYATGNFSVYRLAISRKNHSMIAIVGQLHVLISQFLAVDKLVDALCPEAVRKPFANNFLPFETDLKLPSHSLSSYVVFGWGIPHSK